MSHEEHINECLNNSESESEEGNYHGEAYWVETSMKPQILSGSMMTAQKEYPEDKESSNGFVDKVELGDADDHAPDSDSEPESEVTDDEDIDDYDTVDDAKHFRETIGKLLVSGFTGRGDFAGYGKLHNAPNPQIVIDGLENIRLPLDSADAERIISQSEQAPFGKENRTIVDLSVRKTWQIDESRIRFDNLEWVTHMEEQIIPKTAEKLGLDPNQVDAHLHKLLLYGEGGNFEAHQDTEKELGMFGTLIIVLPSPFTGGGMTATHGLRNMVFDTAEDSENSTSFICTYSDVLHQIHEVTSGYRLVLTYNLLLKRQYEPKPDVSLPTAAEEEIRAVFKDWLAQLDAGKPLPSFGIHKCVDVLLEGALLIRSLELFTETMKRSQLILFKLRTSNWTAAIKTFGFAPLRDLVEEVVLKDENPKMDKKDSVWRCNFLKSLRRTDLEDPSLKSWIRKQYAIQLLRTRIFDQKAFSYVIEYCLLASHRTCQLVLSLFLNNLEEAPEKSLKGYHTPCCFINTVFRKFIQNEEVSEWCRDQLYRLVDNFNENSNPMDIKCVAKFIDICVEQSAHLTYIPTILEAFSRPFYDSIYLDKVICIFADSMDKNFYEDSPTWRDQLFISFAAHFYTVAKASLKRPQPPLPDNYTLRLPRVFQCNSIINEFLGSSFKHVIVIKESDDVLRGVRKIAEQLGDAITYEVLQGMIIVRKVLPPPANMNDSDSESVTSEFMDTLEWGTAAENSLCYLETTCECCQKIIAYLNWMRDQRIFKRF